MIGTFPYFLVGILSSSKILEASKVLRIPFKILLFTLKDFKNAKTEIHNLY